MHGDHRYCFDKHARNVFQIECFSIHYVLLVKGFNVMFSTFLHVHRHQMNPLKTVEDRMLLSNASAYEFNKALFCLSCSVTCSVCFTNTRL